jgi:hypothetical protein
MSGRNTRNEHHNILLLPEIDARRVVVIGTTTSNRCKIPNTTRNPINALSMCASSCSHNAHISGQLIQQHVMHHLLIFANLSLCNPIVYQIQACPQCYGIAITLTISFSTFGSRCICETDTLTFG